MVKDVTFGNTKRKSFIRHDEIIQMPDLLEIQKKSYQWFFDVGLRQVFKDVGCITDNYFLEPTARFADIEEDEKLLHPLCNEYAKVL